MFKKGSFKKDATYVFSMVLISITSTIVFSATFACFDEEGNLSKQLDPTKLISRLLC